MDEDIASLMQALPERVNEDPALVRLGRYLSTELLLEAGERGWHLVVERGAMVDVVPGPLRMRPWVFALRASPAAWSRFWRPLPAPGYHDIFAMARYGHLRIEGDLGPLLANLRYVKEVVALPRRMLMELAS